MRQARGLLSVYVYNAKDEYVDLVDQLSGLPDAWKYRIQLGLLTNEQVREEFEKIMSWIEAQQKRLDEWIDSHMENIYRKPSFSGTLDFWRGI